MRFRKIYVLPHEANGTPPLKIDRNRIQNEQVQYLHETLKYLFIVSHIILYPIYSIVESKSFASRAERVESIAKFIPMRLKLWAVVVWILYYVITMYLGVIRTAQVLEKGLNGLEYMKIFERYGSTIVLTDCLVQCYRKQGDLVKFLNLMGQLDMVLIADMNFRLTPLTKYVRKYIKYGILLIVGLMVFRLIMILLSPHLSASYLVIRYMIPEYTRFTICFLTWQFCSFLLIIRERFKDINRNLLNIGCSESQLEAELMDGKLINASNEIWQNDNGNKLQKHDRPNDLLPSVTTRVRQIEVLRQSHYQLCEQSKIINDAFAVQILGLIAYTWVLCVNHVYELFLSRTSFDILMNISRLITFFFVGILSMTTGHYTAKESQKTITIIHTIRYEQGDVAMAGEIFNFGIQMIHQNVSLTAYQFFGLSLQILQSFFGAVLTYVVVIIQFSPDEGDD